MDFVDNLDYVVAWHANNNILSVVPQVRLRKVVYAALPHLMKVEKLFLIDPWLKQSI